MNLMVNYSIKSEFKCRSINGAQNVEVLNNKTKIIPNRTARPNKN